LEKSIDNIEQEQEVIAATRKALETHNTDSGHRTMDTRVKW